MPAPDTGVDCFFDTVIEGQKTRFGVEVKSGTRTADARAVRQAFTFRESGHFDRAMVISRDGFSRSALVEASTRGPGEIDLLGPEELRNWLFKHQPAKTADAAAQEIVRVAMRQLAEHVAQYPETLRTLEWRDLERLLREVFDGLGYDTTLTRSGKDGGFDLELRFRAGDRSAIYLVEVKHWADSKPAIGYLRKLVEVTAARQATGGLLLSTSGFTRPAFAGLARMSTPLLGDLAAQLLDLELLGLHLPMTGERLLRIG